MFVKLHAFHAMGNQLQSLSNINGKIAMHSMPNVYGLAAAVLVDDVRLSKL